MAFEFEIDSTDYYDYYDDEDEYWPHYVPMSSSRQIEKVFKANKQEREEQWNQATHQH